MTKFLRLKAKTKNKIDIDSLFSTKENIKNS